LVASGSGLLDRSIKVGRIGVLGDSLTLRQPGRTESAVGSVCFTPCGRYVLGACGRRLVRWDIADVQARELIRRTRNIGGVCVSSSSQLMIVREDGGHVWLYTMQPLTLVGVILSGYGILDATFTREETRVAAVLRSSDAADIDIALYDVMNL